jgi:hypothetical protein
MAKVIKKKDSFEIQRQKINTLTEAEQFEELKNHWNISYFNNPSERMQLYAVRKHPDHIDCIKNPTERVQMEAIKQVPALIRCIKNPSEQIIREVMESNIYALLDPVVLRNIPPSMAHEIIDVFYCTTVMES